MIVLDAAPGTLDSSPITGRMSGPASNEFLRSLVEREAGAAKLAIVPTFMKHVVVRHKGGSGGSSGTEVGYSDFREVSLPIKGATGRITLRKYLLGLVRLPAESRDHAGGAGGAGRFQARNPRRADPAGVGDLVTESARSRCARRTP